MSDPPEPHFCPTCQTKTIHAVDTRRTHIAKRAPEWARLLGRLFFWHPITWVIVLFRLYDWPFRDFVLSPTYRCPKCNELLDGSFTGSWSNPRAIIHTIPDGLRGRPMRELRTAGVKHGYRKIGVSKVEGVTVRVPGSGESRPVLLLSLHQALERSGPVALSLRARPRTGMGWVEVEVVWKGLVLGTLPETWGIPLAEGRATLANWSAVAHAVVGWEPFKQHLGLRLTLYEREGAVPAYTAPQPTYRPSPGGWRPEEDDDLHEPPYDPGEEWY